MMAYSPSAPPLHPSGPLFSASEVQNLNNFLTELAHSDPLVSVSSYIASPTSPLRTQQEPPTIWGSLKPSSRYSAATKQSAWGSRPASGGFMPEVANPLPSDPQLRFPPELAEMKAARESKMRQQAEELTAWMNARGIPSLGGAGGESGSSDQHGRQQEAGPPREPPSLDRSDAGNSVFAAAPEHKPEASARRYPASPSSLATLLAATATTSKPDPGVDGVQRYEAPVVPPAKSKGKGKSKDGADAKEKKNGLLTQEQKRANHIASEQKRRAAIRQGYDRLCDVVPSLRAALAAQTPNGVPKRRSSFSESESGNDDDDGTEVSKKRKQVQGYAAIGDGRQGPRSEAVVLAQTVEYLTYMSNERQELLTRLSRIHEAARREGLHIESAKRAWEKPWAAGRTVD